jgi:Transposase zinc-ribbon domain
MARNSIQFQKGLSLLDFQRFYETEELCVAALERARWPAGFCCPRCASHGYGIAGTILQAT